MNKLNARKANKDDIDNILELQSRYLYSKNKESLNSKTGLINNEFSYDDIMKCLESDDCIVMLLENPKKDVIAYIISISFNQLNNSKPELTRIVAETKKIQNVKEILLIEHIVVHKKIGALKLLNALYDEAKDKYKHVCGEIMTFPVENEVSKRFFSMLKGEIIGSIKYKDNTIWDVFYSPARDNFKSFFLKS